MNQMNQVNQTQQTAITVIKTNVLPCGNVESTGSYIARNDKRKPYSFKGSYDVNARAIERMQNAGYEFQHCIIRKHK